jgi:hypothetical protein
MTSHDPDAGFEAIALAFHGIIMTGNIKTTYV